MCTDSGCIKIFDSLASMGVSVETVLQLARIYSVPANHSSLTIHRQSVQQQKGDVDCGLFAVAYATEVCLGRNPEEAMFLQSGMRSHLHRCISRGVMSSFPRALQIDPEAVLRPTRGVLTVQVFCYCKMPAQYDASMIECETCGRWYHCRCVQISDVPDHWDCPQCC